MIIGDDLNLVLLVKYSSKTARNCLYIAATILVVTVGRAPVYAEGDVTVVSTNSAPTAPPPKTVASDGTPVIHKSLHKKKSSTTATAQSSTGYSMASSQVAASTPISDPAFTSPVPTVETGLPVARYPGMGTPIKGVSTYSPAVTTLPAAQTHPALFASTFPSSVVPLTSSLTGNYSTTSRETTPSSDFTFTNFTPKMKTTYPWKKGIITTMFWIGEGSTPISSTTNVQSSWDEDWLPNNHGSDNPNNRNGYASGSHASTLNPFYVALPFNDLAFPEKAHEWLPRGWYRPPKDGRQVSACKDRWVWIKNEQGRSCFAQWEDVGPLRYDHAEYVFGSERPIGLGDDHAGLDVSPAVAQYLGIDGKNRITSWRFVDDADVWPGPWLLLDEQAVLYTALHQMKNSGLPIQRATEPIDDPSNMDSNKKKVDASKG